MAIREARREMKGKKFNREQAIAREEKFETHTPAPQTTGAFIFGEDAARQQVLTSIPEVYHAEYMEKLVASMSRGRQVETERLISEIAQKEFQRRQAEAGEVRPLVIASGVTTVKTYSSDDEIPEFPEIDVPPVPEKVDTRFGIVTYNELCVRLAETIGGNKQYNANEIANMFFCGEIDAANKLVDEIIQEKESENQPTIIEKETIMNDQKPAEVKFEVTQVTQASVDPVPLPEANSSISTVKRPDLPPKADTAIRRRVDSYWATRTGPTFEERMQKFGNLNWFERKTGIIF